MRLQQFTLVFTLSAIAVMAGLWFGAGEPVQATNYQAFTATSVDVKFQGNNQISTTQIVHGRKADGSWAEVIYLNDPNGQPVQMMNLVDAPRSRQVFADGLTQSTTTYRHDWNWIPDLCTTNPGPPGETLHVFRTIRMLDLLDMGGTTIKTEIDQAPDLGCYPLLQKVYVSEDGISFRLVQSTEVTAITLGDPDSSMFVLPTGYTERKPTEVIEEFGRRYPSRAKSASAINSLRHLDRIHESSGSH